MICPVCMKETLSILDYCENCKANLIEYHKKREKYIQGTGEQDLGKNFKLESKILNWGPIGGFVIMLGSIAWFIAGYINNYLFYYPPILFFIGLFGFIKGLLIYRKRKILNKIKENGEIVD